MAVNSNFQIPTEMEPGLGISEQVMRGIGMAHQIMQQRQQLALEQQRIPIAQQQAQAQTSEAATAAARQQMEAPLVGAQTQGAIEETRGRKLENDLRQGFITKMQTPANPEEPQKAANPSTHSLGPLPQGASQYDAELWTRADALGTMTPDEVARYKGAIMTSRQNALMNPKEMMKPVDEAEQQIQADRAALTRQNIAQTYESQHPKSLEQATSSAVAAQRDYQQNPTPQNKVAADNAEIQRKAAYKDRINEASQQAQAISMAQGRDYEAMIRTGTNPITKEKLGLNNAPDSMLVDTKGSPVPLVNTGLYKPTQNERQTADTARQVLAITDDLKGQITKNPELIGPLMGRSTKAFAQVGVGERDAQKMLDDINFLQSAATKMHTGRFSNAILEKMNSLVGAQMNPQQFLGGLDSIKDVAGRYAKEDQLVTVGEYRQMQQSHTAAEASTNTAAPRVRPPGAASNAVYDDKGPHGPGWYDPGLFPQYK